MIAGEIVYLDRFGNAVTNIPAQAAFPLENWEIHLGSQRGLKLHRFYSEAPHGSLVGICGSTGFLELAVRDDSAAQKAKLAIGSAVRLVRSSSKPVR
jgi:S-adenosylmethionine hydrolase